MYIKPLARIQSGQAAGSPQGGGLGTEESEVCSFCPLDQSNRLELSAVLDAFYSGMVQCPQTLTHMGP